jgi:hypothetical protein
VIRLYVSVSPTARKLDASAYYSITVPLPNSSWSSTNIQDL